MMMTRPFKGFVLLILLASILLAWYGHWWGMHLTFDSRQYLAAAKSFRDSGQFVGDGIPYTYWPPLFPIILSLFSEPLTALKWLNIAVKTGLFFSLLKLSREMLNNKETQIAFLIFTFCGVHLTMVSVFVWSELIFMALSAAFLISLHSYHISVKRKWIVLALGFLLCVQRNAGLFFVSGAAIWMLVDNSTNQSIGFRLRNAIIFFLATTMGFLAWSLYVSFIFVNEDFVFYEQNFFNSIPRNYRFIGDALQKAFVPFSFGSIAFIPLMLLLMAHHFRKELIVQSKYALLFWVIVIYLVGMALVIPFDRHDADRYITVILPYITLLFLAILENWFNNTKGWRHWAVLSVLLFGLVYLMSRTIKNVLQWHEMSCFHVEAKE